MEISARRKLWLILFVGFLFFAMQDLRANAQGIITTVVGNGTQGFSGDGGLAIDASIAGPIGVSSDNLGNIIFADQANHRIRKVDSSGIITTIAGNGTAGFNGNGSPATNMSLFVPYRISTDESNNIFFADKLNHRIRKVDTSGNLTTVAGNGIAGFSGDGTNAINASLNIPESVFVDTRGNIFIADSGNNRVRKVDTSGIITTFAGNGENRFNGADGLAINRPINPTDIHGDEEGNLFIADQSHHRIKKVDSDGNMTTLAGNSTPDFKGDGGLAKNASFRHPASVFVDKAGNIFIGDSGNVRIRKIDTSGIITTVAGNGNNFFSGDNGLATEASFSSVTDVSLDASGNIFIVEHGSHRIRKITPFQPSVASFLATPTTGTTPLTVQFTDNSTGTIDSRQWNFGDDSADTQQNPSHTYTIAGNYTVSLTVTGPGGSDTETKTNFITVSDPIPAPVAVFSANPTIGASPLTVNFIDQSTGNVDTWSWDFGDGSADTQQNPSHTYNSAGIFTVSLTVTGAGGSDTETKAEFINVTAPVVNTTPTPASTPTPNSTVTPTPAPTPTPSPTPTLTLTPTPTPTLTPIPTPTATPTPCIKPEAEFNADKISILEDDFVQFTDLSSENPTSWIWDFGDGSLPDNSQNPAHTFTKEGRYSITLTAGNSCGTDIEEKIDFIEVASTAVKPAADFTVNKTSGVEPLTVVFQDKSKGGPTSWFWEFGDNNTSAERNPVHTYLNCNAYSPSLTVSNEKGENRLEKTNLINVKCLDEPDAEFLVDKTSGFAPMEVQFVDKSTADPSSWGWEFGDGANSSNQNPRHTYQRAGIFTVGLMAGNSKGADWEIKTNLINVLPENEPTAAFKASPQAGIAPMDVQFTDASQGNPDSWIWEFGDGAISSLQNPAHTYKSAGFYSVTLIAGNSNGIDREQQINLVNVIDQGEPVAEFIATPLTGFFPMSVNFTDLSNGNIDNRLWEFGDGATGSGKNPVHKYNSQGIFSVELTVSGSSGTDSEKKTNLINVMDGGASGLFAAFEADKRIDGPGSKIVFKDLSSGNISGRLWDFGDNTTSSKQNPDHTYDKKGVYAVNLSVFNNEGNADTITKPAYIEIKEEDEIIKTIPTVTPEPTTPEPESTSTLTPTPTPLPPELTTLTVSPTSASKSFMPQNAVVTALDQNGEPMSGVRIEAIATGRGAKVRPSSKATNVNGEAMFKFKFGFIGKNGEIRFNANEMSANITQRN